MLLYEQSIAHCVWEMLHHIFKECLLSRNKQYHLKITILLVSKKTVTKDYFHFVEDRFLLNCVYSYSVDVYRPVGHHDSFYN